MNHTWYCVVAEYQLWLGKQGNVALFFLWKHLRGVTDGWTTVQRLQSSPVKWGMEFISVILLEQCYGLWKLWLLWWEKVSLYWLASLSL